MERESENVQNHIKYSGDPKKTLRNPEFYEAGFRMVRLSNGRDHSNKTGLQPVSRPVELVHYFEGWGVGAKLTLCKALKGAAPSAPQNLFPRMTWMKWGTTVLVHF